MGENMETPSFNTMDFFFQAEDGIRDRDVTGVQTCALPINALFRRVDALRRPETPGEIMRRGPLTLDTERMQAQWDARVVLLSLTEFWIVHALARHPGHVRNRQQLMDAANVVLDDTTITSHAKP